MIARRWTWLAAALLLVGCGDDESTSECQSPTPCGIQSGTTIELADGVLEGASEAGVRRFMGIPFAAPPIGPLRFAPPASPIPWDGVRAAQSAGPPCVQRDFLSGQLVQEGDEDCLTLNVWLPDATPTEALPVMVWIHGGGFEGGSGDANGGYAGDVLARERGVVVVTLNYRLGPLGFLAHPSLTSEGAATGSPSSGNYGLEDQRAALQWVQRNIESFGGDPNNVTIFGESAGGISVCGQLVSPAAAGLFHAAIIESGPCSLLDQPLSSSEQQGQSLATALNCEAEDDVAACLRSKSATELTLALPNVTGLLFGEGARWGPNIDGSVIPDAPQKLVERGAAADVPVIIGSNKDEGSLFVWLAGLNDIDEATYEQLIGEQELTAPNAAAILARYPAANYPTPAAALAALSSDGLFTCPTRQTARALRDNGHTVFRYQFTFEPDIIIPNLGAFHAAELAFIFGHDAFGFGDTAADAPDLSSSMQGYWTQFARTGAPNADGQSAWSAYGQDEGYLELGEPIAAKAALLDDACDFWDAL